MSSEAEKIAAALTKAQRAYLTTKAEWRAPAYWAAKRWMTFPPSSTHRVLCALGLTDQAGQIRDLGLEVRAILQRFPAPEQRGITEL